MARIKIKNLPRDQQLSREEMKAAFGGYLSTGVRMQPLSSLGGTASSVTGPLMTDEDKAISLPMTDEWLFNK